MATTRIIPLHAGKGRTVGKAISDIIAVEISMKVSAAAINRAKKAKLPDKI